MSASTNIATALAAFHNGCVPVPVDSERETWNLDLDLVEDLITDADAGDHPRPPVRPPGRHGPR